MYNLKVACKRCNSHKGDKLPAPEVVAAIRIKMTASITNPTHRTMSYEEQRQDYFERARNRYVTKDGPSLTTEQRIALQKQDEDRRR